MILRQKTRNLSLILIVVIVISVVTIILPEIFLRTDEKRIIVNWRCTEIKTPSQIFSPQNHSFSKELNVNLEMSRNPWVDKYRLRGHQITFNIILHVNEMEHIDNVEVYARITNPKDMVFGEAHLSLQLLPLSSYNLPFSYLINTGMEMGTWKAEFFPVDTSNETLAFDADSIEFEVVAGPLDVIYLIILKVPEKLPVVTIIAILSASLGVLVSKKIEEYVKELPWHTVIAAIILFIVLFILFLYLYSLYLLTV